MAKRRKSKNKDVMNKNMSWKYLVAPCALVIICSCVYLMWYINNKNSTYENIDYIRGFMTSSGTLNDFSNKIGMHDPEKDLKWFMTDKTVRIEFGRIVMEWEKDEFLSDDNLTHLSTIGITADVQTDKDTGKKKLHLYYQGTEMERWIK